MNLPTKTLTSGFSMPVLGLGTWTMGGEFDRDPTNDDERDIAAVRRAIEAGITHIDTAELYAEGHAEEIVGHTIDGMRRDTLFLASKVSGNHLRYDDVLRAAEGSLRRLRTDYIDLYMVHWPDPAVPMRETFRAMDALVERGLVRHIGVSNFTKERLAEAQALASHPVVTNQVHYNLTFREPERTGLLTYCQEHDVLLAAWRPVQRLCVAPLLRDIANSYGKTPVQIALNWLISQRNVVSLMKTSQPAHLEENLGALDWMMKSDDVERLRREFPEQHAVSDQVPLG